MTNTDVVVKWIKAMDDMHGYAPKRLSTASLHADGVYLVSYATPIAKHVNGKFLMTSKKFSQTTNKHLSIVKSLVPESKLVLVDEIPCPPEAFPWKMTGK